MKSPDSKFLKIAARLGEMDEATVAECERALDRAERRGRRTSAPEIAVATGMITVSGRQRVLHAFRDARATKKKKGSRSDLDRSVAGSDSRPRKKKTATRISAPPPPRPKLALAAIVAGVVVGGAAALFVALRSNDSPPVEPVAQTTVNVMPQDVRKVERVEPVKADAGPSLEDQVATACGEARKLESDGRAEDALAILDRSIAKLQDKRARDALGVERSALLGRERDRLAADATEAERLADAGDEKAARELASKARSRAPRELRAETDGVDAAIAKAQARRAAREEAEKQRALAETKKKEAIDAYAATRSEIDRALAALDVEKAKAALAGLADPSAVADQRKLDERKIEGIARLIQFATDGYKLEAGRPIELEMRSGPAVKGKLLRVEGGKLSVDAMGGEIAVAMADLAPRPFLLTARRGAKKNTDEYLFARGVLFAVLGDTKAAIEALEGAATIPEAEELVRSLKERGAPPKPVEKSDKPEKPIAKTDEPKKDPASSAEDDQRLEKALAQKLKVRATVHGGQASFEYSFGSDDQLLDWKNGGFLPCETGSHELVSRRESGLLLGGSSGGAAMLTHALRLKGDFEIEVRLTFNQIPPSGDFCLFFGEKNGKSTGVSFGQQLVKISSGGVKPLAGGPADRARWASEKSQTFKVVRKGDQVEVLTGGTRAAVTKGDFDGRFGFLSLGSIRCVVQSIRVTGAVEL